MKALRAEIGRLLAERRPDRYTVGGFTEDGESETAWLRDIADEIEPLIPVTEAVQALAINLVNQQEGGATRRANAFLRELDRTGQPPMLWAEEANWPISVVSRDPDAKRKKIEERVALRAATPIDARLFVVEERRRNDEEYEARNSTCRGAEMCAAGAQAAGFQTIWEWIESVAPTPTAAAASEDAA